MTTEVQARSDFEAHAPYLTGHSASSTQHHEWRTAENSAGHLLPTLKKMVAERPRLNLLDVGAGSGTITADLAALVPEGRVTAVDMSEDILQRAKGFAAAKGVSNVGFKQANAYHLPFNDGAFDIVYASMILGHLDQPEIAVGEMLRVSKKPGGVVALRESDLRATSIHPELPGIRAQRDMMCAVHEANGGTVNGGARLVSWVLANGIKREQIHATAGTWCFATPSDRAVWSSAMITRCESGATRERAIALGIADEAGLEEMKRDWKTWAGSDEGFCGALNGEVVVYL